MSIDNQPAVKRRGALLLLFFTLLLYAACSVFAKLSGNAMEAGNLTGSLVFLALEFLMLVVYSLLWQVVLKHLPLNVAYASKGLCTLWTCLFGILLFQEALTLGKALGTLLVLGGVYLVVTDPAAEEA
ncbi:MAG: transporter [Clostridiales bacterium]|nr:transporter [Clostridiales bacterium]